MKITAKVNKVYNRQVGQNTFYSLCLDHEDEKTGKDIWVGTARNKPSCKENDIVTLNATQDAKGYWQTDAADIEVGQKGTPTAVASKGGWNDPARQKSIVAQSSVKMAMDFLEIALANGALVLGSAKAKAADKFEILEAAVMEKAKDFYNVALLPDEFFGEPEAPEGDIDEDDFNPVGE